MIPCCLNIKRCLSVYIIDIHKWTLYSNMNRAHKGLFDPRLWLIELYCNCSVLRVEKILYHFELRNASAHISAHIYIIMIYVINEHISQVKQILRHIAFTWKVRYIVKQFQILIFKEFLLCHCQCNTCL